MIFFDQIRKTLFLTLVLSAAVAVTANAYEIKGGEVKVGSSVNMRSEASTSSSVVTKLVNNDRVAVIDETEGWYKVFYNGQNGYISSDYVELNDIMNVEPGAAKITTEVLNVREKPSTDAGVIAKLRKGDTVKIIGINSAWLKIETASYKGYIHPDYVDYVAYSISETANGNVSSAAGTASTSTRQQIIDYAATLLGTPYVYAGTSPKGFDCSGYTQYVFAHFNISLPHSSSSQYKSSVTKISRSELQPGDLVFFSNGGSGVGHVGIYVGNNNFIHSPRPGRSVCYDSLDSSYYSSHYIGAGTVF